MPKWRLQFLRDRRTGQSKRKVSSVSVYEKWNPFLVWREECGIQQHHVHSQRIFFLDNQHGSSPGLRFSETFRHSQPLRKELIRLTNC